MKPIILSHRYLMRGKSKPDNQLSQLVEAEAKGFNFFETDIRRLPSGKFYISHDPHDSISHENNADAHLNIWKQHGFQIALNIKELGYEEDLVKFLEHHGVIDQVFLFDFDIEFLGAEPQSYISNIHTQNPNLRCAVRVSDHNETIERALAIKGSDIVWLDEFDSLWVEESHIRTLKMAGKTVYCIAPDLHEFDHDAMTKRFADFIDWEVDGICTDYALELKAMLS